MLSNNLGLATSVADLEVAVERDEDLHAVVLVQRVSVLEGHAVVGHAVAEPLFEMRQIRGIGYNAPEKQGGRALESADEGIE